LIVHQSVPDWMHNLCLAHRAGGPASWGKQEKCADPVFHGYQSGQLSMRCIPWQNEAPSDCNWL
jgi:hypothetical protein